MDIYNGKLCLTVVTLQGVTMEVETWGYRSVHQLKYMLATMTVPPEDMHLVYRDQILSDHLPLGAILRGDATLTLVLRITTGF